MEAGGTAYPLCANYPLSATTVVTMQHSHRINGITLLGLAFLVGFSNLGRAQEALPAPPEAETAEVVETNGLYDVLFDTDVVHVSEANRMARLQLVDASGESLSPEANSMVTLVRPTGQTGRLTPDSNGLITFEASPGLHALIVGRPNFHAAIPFVVREWADGDVPTRTTPIPVPIFELQPGAIGRAISKFMPPTNGDPMFDIDNDLISSGTVVASRNYHVRIGASGMVRGQLFSLLLPSASGSKRVGGTNVLIHRDGRLIARAITDSRGRIAVGGLRPGPHGLIAIGPAGYTAFAFEVLGPQSGDPTDSDFASTDGSTQSGITSAPDTETLTTTAVLQGGAGGVIPDITSGLVLPIIPIPPALFPFDQFIEEDEAEFVEDIGFTGPPMVGGGFGGPGSGFGGGGAGGGGGGFGGGGLLGLAGLAAALALGLDSDDDPIVVQPASPGFVIE